MNENAEAKQTILIVEDNEINRSLLEEYLTDSYNVLTACDGVEAMDIIEKKMSEISLVLLDLMMPNLNGLQMLDELNEYGWIEHVPVVIISAEKSPELKEKAYLKNVYHFITKPFTYEEVMACVRRMLL